MTWLDQTTTLLSLPAFLIGLLAGWLYFVTLERVVQMLAAGKILAVGLQFGRFAFLAGVLFLLAKIGALPLLTGAAGILLARIIVLKRSELR